MTQTEFLGRGFKGEGIGTGNFSILPPYKFLADFTAEARHAKTRVWLQAMNYEADTVFDSLSSTLRSAAAKQVDARIHLDHFSQMFTHGRCNMIPTVSSRRRQEHRAERRTKAEVVDTLAKTDVIVDLTNPPTAIQKLWPAAGRNHTKLAFVDNVAWIGGVAFSEDSFGQLDFMVRIEDPRIVDPLADKFLQINNNRPASDYEVRCDDQTTLLVDAGIPGTSIIFENALHLVNNAQNSIRLISQHTTEGRMLEAIGQASNDDIDARIVVTDPRSFDRLQWKMYDWVNRYKAARAGYTGLFDEYPNYAHAKLLFADRGLPSQVVLIGSHNLLDSGVRYGTEEVALRSTDATLINNVTKYYDKIAAQTKPRKNNSVRKTGFILNRCSLILSKLWRLIKLRKMKNKFAL